MQVVVNRRYAKGLSVLGSYTWSKALGTTSYTAVVADNEKWNYGRLSQDRRHNLQVNYTYDLPNTGKRVKSKLLSSRYADGLTANVDTMRGRVKLTGFAGSAESKEAAGNLAMNTRGVRAVSNQLVVDATKGVAKNPGTDVADGWITMKVKSTYMYSSNVDGSDIAVSTNAGVVKLTGKMDSGAERALAIELARNVRGVKSVDSSLLTM